MRASFLSDMVGSEGYTSVIHFYRLWYIRHLGLMTKLYLILKHYMHGKEEGDNTQNYILIFGRNPNI